MAACTVLAVTACAPPATRTTFLDNVDLTDMTDRMAASFAADPVIGTRSGSSRPWVISIDRVANHTNQIIPSREKWLYVARLRAQLAQSDLAERSNLMWVVEPERWPPAPGELSADDEALARRTPPTHLLAAEFHTLTNTSGSGRTDTYLCAFQLTEIGTGRLVWEDHWEVKRAASGLTYD